MDVERKSGRVTRLRNVALTNNPAMFSITPLVAASDKEPKMRKLACKACGDDIEPDGDEGYKNMVAYHKDHAPKMKASKKMTDTLALSEDASAEEVERKLTKLADFKAEVLKIAGKEKGSEALGVLMALKTSNEEIVKLRMQVAEQDKATKTREFDSLVEKGKTERKLTPALVESWVPKLREAGEAGVVQLRSFLDVAPVLTSDGSVKQPTVDQVTLTDDEKKIAKLMGNDEKEVVAYKQKQAAGAAR
jgi:phage I-like protein